MAWWSSLFGSNEKGFSEIKENAPEEIAGLNVRTAIEAHTKWKHRLKEVINGTSTEVLDPLVVSKDDQCALGKWIHTEGKQKFGTQPGFQLVATSHAHFHKCAGHTLELAQKGKHEKAEADLSNGDFARASLDVTLQLMRLWRDAGTK